MICLTASFKSQKNESFCSETAVLNKETDANQVFRLAYNEEAIKKWGRKAQRT